MCNKIKIGLDSTVVKVQPLQYKIFGSKGQTEIIIPSKPFYPSVK